MLLSLMRKNAKSWLIKFLMVIIAVVFVFYFGYSFTSSESGRVATVNGEAITSQEYQKAYSQTLSNLQSQYKDAWNDNLIKTFNLERTTLNTLIQQKILSQEAERIGLDITDKEVQDIISQYQAFQTDGVFDNARYSALLANNNMTAETFEESTAQSLLQQKLAQFLTTFLSLSDQEVKDMYTYTNQKVKISFVKFSPDEFVSSVNIDKSMMDKFFEEHKENYRIPAKIKIAYISIDPALFKGQVNLNEDDIKNYYEDNRETFKEAKQIKARHILFYLAGDTAEDIEKAVKEKAASVLARAKAGEDFTKLAREYSEDTTTKENGGDLGYFQEGQMVAAFEEAAFKLKKDEISELVRTDYGYHIIKVDDIKAERQKELQEVHDQISALLINNESKDLADEKALSLVDQMPYNVDLVQYARKMDIASSSTDYFSADKPVYFLEEQTKTLDMLFALQTNEVSDVIELNNEFYIMQVIDKKNSYLPAIEEVSTQVEIDSKSYLAVQKAKAAAEEYLSKLIGENDWNTLAQERGRTPQTTDFFTRLAFPEGMDSNIEGLQSAAFKLSRDKRYPDSVFENDTGAFVIRWEDEKGIDEEKFKEEKGTYTTGIISTKKQYIFSGWISRLMDNADIDTSGFEKNK
jgi:peptidyl-prolyl cis-trans isomerase D